MKKEKRKRPSDLVLPPSATIKQALQVIAESEFQIVFLVDDSEKVIGCLTDGDIRRAFLRGETLDSKLERIQRGSFFSVQEGTSSRVIFDMLRKNGIRQIPILNKQGKLVAVRVLEDFIGGTDIKLPAVIMAGGKGTRLLPHTRNIPKPLLRIGEKTIIETLIESLRAKGIEEFHVSVNYLADQIIDHLGDGSRFGCTIHFVKEDSALGTAGALSLLKGRIGKDFFVVNGDVVSTVDLSLFHQFHREHGAVATVCAKLFHVSLPYGVVNMDNERSIMRIDEKPDLSFRINSGIYCFSPSVFDLLESNESLDMPALIHRLVELGLTVKCFESGEPWIDIGTHEEFEKARKYIGYLSTNRI